VLKTQVDILEGETLYVRFGDWFAWSISLLSIAIILVQCVRRRGREPFNDRAIDRNPAIS
jgi:apolipoprotein N-acyltransferase